MGGRGAEELGGGFARGFGGGGGELAVAVGVVGGEEGEFAEAGCRGDAGLGGDEALADVRGPLEGGEAGLRARVIEPGGEGFDVDVVMIAEGEEGQLGREEVGEEIGLGDVGRERGPGVVEGRDHGELIAKNA